jgi:hypothetical protein
MIQPLYLVEHYTQIVSTCFCRKSDHDHMQYQLQSMGTSGRQHAGGCVLCDPLSRAEDADASLFKLESCLSRILCDHNPDALWPRLE